jgi:3-deoxy-D-manno-oct-2-ulosonic acid (Kdo) hydroxylase
MSLIQINDYDSSGWRDADSGERARFYCEQLESGRVLFFDNIPFDLPQDHQEFLLSQRQTDSAFHKNISYRPKQNAIRGLSSGSDAARLREIMEHYSAETTRFVSDFLAPYAGKLQLDFASFRPLEEKGRNLPFKKRNDLLHVDSFPTRPTRGARILRVFTNINPTESRIWNIAEPFDLLAERYAGKADLNKFAAKKSSSFARILNRVGLPVGEHSAYDRFMLHFHDYLKANEDFQANCDKQRLEFPPRSTWLVYTDGVPHAALSGRFALEHTYIVPVNALVAGEKAPISILETMCNQKLSA